MNDRLFKTQAAKPDKECRKKCTVDHGSEPNSPRNQWPVMNDQIADVEELEVGKEIVNNINDRLERVAKL